MNSDDKEDHLESTEDAFYKADYDDDTIDYDLDTDKFLEEETFEPDVTMEWGDMEASDKPMSREEPEFETEQIYDEQAEPEEVWYDEDSPEEGFVEPWPVGLIAVAIIALLLLAAGGYGVIQQRSAMQEEIRQLQAALSTTSSNTEVAASRQAQRTLETRNEELQGQLDKLLQENQTLRDSLSDPKPPPESKPIVAPEVKPDSVTTRPEPVPTVTKADTTSTTWFVNFGSYTQEPVANSWAARLKSEEGKVVVVSGNKGSTRYFRVRVINLPSREIAEKIARQLEQTHNLPRLWIGKQ